MNNLHISLTEFRNESRVLKQANTIASLKKIEQVYIATLHADDLKENETYSESIKIKRFTLKTRGLSKGIFSQAIKYFEFILVKPTLLASIS